MGAADLERRLRELARPERAEPQQAYLKVGGEHLGVPVHEVRRAVRQHLRPDHDDVRRLARDLWDRPVFECRLAAVEALTRAGDVLTPTDLPLLERMLREARTWALVDGLAANVVGTLVERHPEVGATLDRWVCDDDPWIRRSALLALLVPLRRGAGEPDRFFRYADALLDDRTFWVRKALGWVLRETGRRRPELVTQWLLPRASRAAGLTVREAVKHLPPQQRDAVLSARSAGAAAPRHPETTRRR